jgi:hypothetical protein
VLKQREENKEKINSVYQKNKFAICVHHSCVIMWDFIVSMLSLTYAGFDGVEMAVYEENMLQEMNTN